MEAPRRSGHDDVGAVVVVGDLDGREEPPRRQLLPTEEVGGGMDRRSGHAVPVASGEELRGGERCHRVGHQRIERVGDLDAQGGGGEHLEMAPFRVAEHADQVAPLRVLGDLEEHVSVAAGEEPPWGNTSAAVVDGDLAGVRVRGQRGGQDGGHRGLGRDVDALAEAASPPLEQGTQ